MWTHLTRTAGHMGKGYMGACVCVCVLSVCLLKYLFYENNKFILMSLSVWI